MSEIERALRASYPAIRGDLERMGIPVRHHRERRQDLARGGGG